MDLVFLGPLPPHRGGSAVLLSLLLPALARRGIRIRVLAPWPSSRRGEDLFSVSNTQVEVFRYQVPFLSSSLDSLPGKDYYDREAREIDIALSSQCAKDPADLIVLGRESYLRHVPGITRASAAPAVLIAHGGRTFEGMVAPSGGKESQELLEFMRSLEGIITVGHHLADKIEGIGIPRPLTIENPVDTRRFAPRPDDGVLRSKLGLRTQDPVVVHISKLSSIKRPLDVVASASLALAQAPNLRYLIIGDGPQREDLQKEVSRRGIEGHFMFSGWLPHYEVADYLNLSDCVLLPSASEGQALVCLEAQACGKTVVASDIDGNRELIDHGVTGMLVPPADPRLLAKATLRVVCNPEIRMDIGSRARKFALRHSLDAVVHRYEKAFTSFANKARLRWPRETTRQCIPSA